MGVGVQGEAGGEVPQHTTDCLDIHSVLEGDGGEGVAEVVKSDLRDASSLQHSLEHIVDTVRGDGAAVGRGEYIGVMERIGDHCTNIAEWVEFSVTGIHKDCQQVKCM